ncbi:MAG: adenosylcobalamin-dependent ribonucleoside-diphosphate reductase [Anaerolineae bacterium]|nr:adenosylcobalamin-dependent ribonucleoside-diphosphate reductase [Anaerolineae bacterium]
MVAKIGKEVKTTANGRGTMPSAQMIDLSDNARTVLSKRYLRRGTDGQHVETIEEMFWRVAWNVAEPEDEHGQDRQAVAVQFYDLLTSKKFFPNSPTFTGAGTPLGQLAACFVLPVDDDMGRNEAGIFQTLRNAALIQQTGGGNGFAFSRLRPKGAIVKSSGGVATGPIGFLRVYDQAFGEVSQGGSRRGANMGVLRIDHPDIREFITCKTNENQITNFNISVGVTDAFMKAVRDDTDFDLVNPQDGKVWETVRARELFDMIVKQAHHNGEPGILFLDSANRDNPVPKMYTIEATNPCGEQFLGPFENCCLGSINLAQHVTSGGKVDWETLRESVEISTRFLDDVVDANGYVPSVPELEVAAKRVRRIGLGIMGLADLMYHLGVRYGSPEGQEFAGQVMEFVHYHAMKTSVELADQRGPFLGIEDSIFNPNNLQWQSPKPLVSHDHDWGRPDIDWESIVKGLKKHGIRNGSQTTIAPTGTISTVAGCEGYGCEPVFALTYIRHFNDNGKDVQLQYTSPLFEKALIEAGLSEEQRKQVIEQVNLTGSCQEVTGLPDSLRHVFVVASDITAEEHVRMQASMQRFVSNAISKTCNFPPAATEEDVAKAYLLAWQLGCKGLTVYVAGSREKVVLETRETAQAKQERRKQDMVEESKTSEETSSSMLTASVTTPEPLPLFKNEVKRPRARVLKGYTYRVETPLGTTFVTVNENGGDQPFELFMHTSKAGSDTAAVSEAMGRLISYILRMNSPIEPRKRLREVVRQLDGIGGGRSLGLGPNRVRSLPDGISQVLDEYLSGDLPDTPVSHPSVSTDSAIAGELDNNNTDAKEVASGPMPGQMPLLPVNLKGDLCPECGQAAVVNEEGCRKCYACGYSEC